MKYIGIPDQENGLKFLSSPRSTKIILDLFGGPFDTSSLSRRTNMRLEDADSIVNQLVDYSIIDTDKGFFTLTVIGMAVHSKIWDILYCLENSGNRDSENDRANDWNADDLNEIYEKNEQVISPMLRCDGLFRKLFSSSGFREEIPFDNLESVNNDEYGFFRKFLIVDHNNSVIKIMPEWSNLLKNLSEYYRLVDFIIENKGYLNIHRLDLLPAFAINTLYKLMPAELYCDPSVDFKQNFGFYIDILRNAERIRGVSTWAKPVIAEALVGIVESGTPVELVISPELALMLLNEKPYCDNSERTIDYPNISIRVAQCRIATGLTVTDKCLSVGFFLNDGMTYDSVFDFVCTSEDARDWGEDLFAYYHRNSIDLNDYISMQIRNS